jgi:peptide/nickel transport system substrate-binding protein
MTVRRLSLSLAMLAAGVALLAAAGLAAPGMSSNAGAEVRKGGTLRLSRFSDVDFVDPALAYAGWSWPIQFATCAKLFNYPDRAAAEGTRLIPEVAKGFPTVSKDGRTYTFDLKQTFRFHTGAPVTASSFAAAFNRDADPRMKSPAVGYMHEIAGADAVIDGRSTAISGVRVLGRYRLQIRLTQPVGDLTARLTMPFFCPVLASTPIDPEGVDNPPGSGPYYVAERTVNRRIVLKRNPYYRGSRPANVDEVVWTIGDSREACLHATEQDRIDNCMVRGIPAAAHRDLAARYGINRPEGRLFVNPALETWSFAFNHDRQAFKGPGQIPLAKAINFAIDRPALARALGYLAGRRTDQMLPTALGRDEGIYPLRGADPATAKKWLAKARIKPTRLVMYTGNAPATVTMAQVLAFDLKQLGIDLDVKLFDFVALIQKASTRGEPYDIVTNDWAVDYADPAGFFLAVLNPVIQDTGNSNYSYFADPAIAARMRAANQLTGDARRKAWADLDVDLMRDNPPWAPFLHATLVNFVSASFGCFLYHPVYGLDIAAACKK